VRSIISIIIIKLFSIQRRGEAKWWNNVLFSGRRRLIFIWLNG